MPMELPALVCTTHNIKLNYISGVNPELEEEKQSRAARLHSGQRFTWWPDAFLTLH